MLTYKKLYQPANLNTNEIILDIETTGLDASIDQLVLLGIIEYEDDNCYIKQYFAEDDNEEIKLLNVYLKHVVDKKIITYNGDKFDIPFLNIRLMQNKLDPIFPEAIDIFKILASQRKYFSFESMKLSDIEKYLGIERDDPSRYKVISKLTEDIKRRDNPWPIMVHNKNDLVATEKLANLGEYFRNILSFKLDSYGSFYLKSVWINNDIGQINLETDSPINDAYFSTSSYDLIINNDNIEINFQVLYGRFDSENTGHVAINIFELENQSNIVVDPNLFIIRENKTYNYKNILKLSKKIIETHL